jgi:hypothetical protein
MLDNFFPTRMDKHLKKNNFLPLDNSPHSKHWSGSDTKELYEKNLKIQPQDWYYRNHSVTYTYNSKGYRTKEFNKIDWAESIVILGCSYVYGVGVDDAHTLSQQLENIMQIPVINLGQGGSSINYNLHNSVILSAGYPTPRAVIMAWPHHSRCVYYDKYELYHYGPWNSEKDSYMDLWSKKEYNTIANAVMAQKIFQQVWKDRTVIHEVAYDYATSELLDCKQCIHIDNARDIPGPNEKGHPGPNTNRNIAEMIYNELKTKI